MKCEKFVGFLFFFLSLLFTTSLQSLNTEEFFRKVSQPIPQWMQEQIDADLNPFTTELSEESLDQFFNSGNYGLFRIRIMNGHMTIEKGEFAQQHGAADCIIPHFFGLNHLITLPDLDILISAGDGIGCRANGPALPIFTISKCKEDKGVILLPDWFALQGYESEKSWVLWGNQQYPWSVKRDVMFFRGGDSGILDNSSYEAWKKSPRPRLVALSIKYPQIVDAKFALSLHHKQFFGEAQRDGYIGDYVPMKDYVWNKYLIDIDGNCASAPRLGLILHSNCVVFKAVTNSMQWFYKALKPYVHFIPVREDFSDLFSQMLWAKEHEKECMQISRNAQKLASEVLSQEAIYEYLYRLLIEYAKRQRQQYDLQTNSMM
ncbi:MAG TPA: glycosyl transferase family 90 [Chlamydiales bacterium]|nr:glycosyl transferase family 90 [Chlamydiales bacterium]